MSDTISLGKVFTSSEALKALRKAGMSPGDLLTRHQKGDKGEWENDNPKNDAGTWASCWAYSAYRLPTGVKIWVVTDVFNQLTTVSLPGE